MIEIGQIKLKGTVCVLKLDEHRAEPKFEIYLEDGTKIGWGYSYAEAESIATTHITKSDVRVNVPFKTLSGVQGTARGFHKSNGKVLATVGLEARQMDSITKVFKDETPAEVIQERKEYDDLVQKTQKAIRVLDDLWTTRIGEEVRKAINVALTSEGG